MQTSGKAFWLSHPIRSAVLIGAIIGFAHALVVEVGGAIHKNKSAVVLMLWPTDTFAPEFSQNGILRTAIILFIEFAGDMLGCAILLGIPAVIFVTIRGTFRRNNR